MNPATEPKTIPATAPGAGPLAVRPYPSGTVLTSVASRGRSVREAKSWIFCARFNVDVGVAVEGDDLDARFESISCAKLREGSNGGIANLIPRTTPIEVNEGENTKQLIGLSIYDLGYSRPAGLCGYGCDTGCDDGTMVLGLPW